MTKRGKNISAIRQKVEDRHYTIDEAAQFLIENSFTNFDETMELAVNLGVDPRHSDQMIRGAVLLPHGTGKKMRVVAFAVGDAAKEAAEAGAETVGAEDLAKKILGGWMDFDAAVATPDMMRVVGKLGRVLGPRGLMPNPKSGTVTKEVGKAVKEIKMGKVEFRVDKAGIIHAPVGKLSFGLKKLMDNIRSFAEAILKARPASAKGKYVKGVAISSTMGPGIKIDTINFEDIIGTA